MNYRGKRAGWGAVVLAAFFLTGAVALGQGGASSIGKFQLVYGDIRFNTQRSRPTDGTVEILRGPNGAANAEFRSAQYDMIAPKIVMQIRNRLVASASATGGVRVITRERTANKQLREAINLRSETATFVNEQRGADNKTITRPARLELRGNVKGSYRSPLFSDSDPLQVDTDAVDIEFPDADTAVVVMRNGRITGTPVEPPAKDEKKKP